MTKIRVVIASKNPVKINAAMGGLQKMCPQYEFSAEPVEVPSGVGDQPLSDEETLKGALNRVENAFLSKPGADFWIGIEGGVSTVDSELGAFAWVVIKSNSLQGKARTGTFFLPQAVKELVEKGVELGTADDIVFGHTNSKQKGGAVGLLTNNLIDRTQLYEQAVILALIPFKNESLYSIQKDDV